LYTSFLSIQQHSHSHATEEAKKGTIGRGRQHSNTIPEKGKIKKPENNRDHATEEIRETKESEKRKLGRGCQPFPL